MLKGSSNRSASKHLGQSDRKSNFHALMSKVKEGSISRLKSIILSDHRQETAESFDSIVSVIAHEKDDLTQI
jgi:hypothetical protein